MSITPLLRQKNVALEVTLWFEILCIVKSLSNLGGNKMERIITVKATGHVSVAPDMIEISINLNSHDFNYEKAIELSNNKIDSLTSALKEIGFSEGLIKTSYFSVNTDYRCDDDNTSIFNGYICNHDLMLRFDLDLHVLSQTIVAISDRKSVV